MSLTKSTQPRINSPETCQQLQDELLLAFPKAIPEIVQHNVGELLSVNNGNANTRSHIIWNPSQGLLHAILLDESEAESRVAITVRPIQPPHPFDLKFANAYVRVFNDDVKAAPLLLRHQELWESLTLSRVPRAIARLTAFSTAPFLRWLFTMEAATHLRYEGASFQPVVLMSKQHEWISKPAGDRYVAFKQPLQFSEALLEEKWIRAIAGAHAVGLHGIGHSGDIVGVFTLPSNANDFAGEVPLPTELQAISVLVRPGTMAFVCAPNGDLYVVLPNGAVFVKSQGRWQYQNFGSFQSLLSKHVPSPIALPLLQLMLDLSYSRNGALFSIPGDLSVLQELVPDSTHPERANRALRAAVSGIRVDSPAHRQILLAAAAVDGATIVSPSGAILDIACMIGEPSAGSLATAGHSGLRRFPGARSTAAWNASILGLGIKVSDDGPISVYSKGHLVGQLG